MSIKRVFGVIIALLLLVGYVYMVIDMIVFALSNSELVDISGSRFEAYKYFVTTIGGLVSALVISVLGITPASALPASLRLRDSGDRLGEIITISYIAIWLLIGISALIVGVFISPEPLPLLGDIGKTWFGLAIGAAYAFFGLEP